MAKDRTFPHVTGIKDYDTQSAIRILFDRLYDQLAAIDALVVEVQDANDTIQDQQDTINQLTQKVNSISATGGVNASNIPGGGDGEDPIDDGGEGAAGCAAAGSSGHVDPLLPMDRVTAGMIICGVGEEFPSLLDVAANQPARDANTEELLGRMIWHLQLHGFNAGRQQNPSGLISGDKLAFVVDGVEVVYDVFSLVPFDQPFTTHMIPVPAPHLVPDGGVPD